MVDDGVRAGCLKWTGDRRRFESEREVGVEVGMGSDEVEEKGHACRVLRAREALTVPRAHSVFAQDSVCVDGMAWGCPAAPAVGRQ